MKDLAIVRKLREKRVEYALDRFEYLSGVENENIYDFEEGKYEI